MSRCGGLQQSSVRGLMLVVRRIFVVLSIVANNRRNSLKALTSVSRHDVR